MNNKLVYTLDNCVGCNRCIGVCPCQGANVAVRTENGENRIVVNQERCITCGACIDVCPCNVLAFPKSTGPGDKGTQLVAEDKYCIKCGACAKLCPNDAITVTRTAVDYTPTSSKSWIKAFEALKN